MPYISQKKRPAMDRIVNLMALQGVKADGDLNYILFKFCKHCVEKKYNSLKNFCGELRQCATEIERKILAKYEDLKEKENGSV